MLKVVVTTVNSRVMEIPVSNRDSADRVVQDIIDKGGYKRWEGAGVSFTPMHQIVSITTQPVIEVVEKPNEIKPKNRFKDTRTPPKPCKLSFNRARSA